MKRAYNILLSVAALLAFAPFVSAQTDWSINGQIKDPKTGATLQWPNENGLHEASDFAYSKDISSPQSDGTYWIRLESFSTGSASFIETAVPADIVLALDLSTSMRASRGTSTQVTTSKGLSYQDVVSARTEATDYLYRDGNNATSSRYQLFAEEANGRYYLYYNASGTNNKNYLSSATQTTTNRNNAAYATSATGAIVTFSANSRLYTGSSRIFALKDATAAFIEEINDNDKQEGGTRLGNRLSLITFTSAATAHRHLVSLTDTNVDELISAVWDFSLTTGTRTDLGVLEANEELDGNVSPGRTRTVVVFTDGEPYYNGVRNYTRPVEAAYPTKTTYDATVYAVGMFSSTKSSDSDVYKFMNYMSSNYPEAQSFDNHGTGSDKGFYYDVSDPNYDLKKVFTDIAHQSGGSSTSLSAASSNVDVVSNSFILPEGTNTTNIDKVVKIFIAKLDEIDEDGEYVFLKEYLVGHVPEDYTYYELDENGERVSDTPKKVDDGITVTLSGTNEIRVKGFDYSSNFCGPVYKLNQPTVVDHYQGYKIIIMIPIKMNPDAVGGPDIKTNGAGSGIYVSDGATSAFVGYESPKVSLPVNIHITKSGLKEGESAKFMIERAILPASGPVVYSNLSWNYVSTVFVTKSKGMTTDPVVYVRGLPANQDVEIEGQTVHRSFVYRISEEGWSWSYDAKTLPQYTDTENIDNPFKFSNVPIDNIDYKVRHAESKATNVFKPGVVEGNVIYDDSKTNVRPPKQTNSTQEP